MPAISIGDALFTKTQQRVLGLLFGKPEQSYYTNEIVRWAAMGRGTVRRELERLAEAGLLLVSRTGNQLHYQANAGSPVYQELLGIVRKTFGLVDVLRTALLPITDQLDAAFVYGSIAKNEASASSYIDLLVITDSLAYVDVMQVLSAAEQTLGRPVNPSLYTRQQITDKLNRENAFLTRVMEQPKLWVKGSEDVLNGIGQSGKN